MNIDEIIEHHKKALSEREKELKEKSFSNIFWEEFSIKDDAFWTIRLIISLFPIIAALLAFLLCMVICYNQGCCANCILCTKNSVLLSGLFIVITLPITVGISGSNSKKLIVIVDIITLICNIFVIEIYERHPIVIFAAWILYVISLYITFKKPFLKWFKLNNGKR